ncbi:MAG: hypothetical protein ABII27_02370 [bacterium]
MKKSLLTSVIFISFLILFSCSRKDRLSNDTFELKVSPAAAAIAPSEEITIRGFGKSPKESNINVVVQWYMYPEGKGILANTTGDSTKFTAYSSAHGTVRIIALYKDFVAESQVSIGQTDIFNDLHAAGFIGTFTKEDSGASTIVIDEVPDIFMEGSKSMIAAYSLPSGGYAGWFVKEGEEKGSETRDMSAYSSGRLRFWVKTLKNLKITINNQDKELDDLGSYTDNEWHEVVIALSSFTLVDFSRISHFFKVTIASDINNNNAISGVFHIDDVRWTVN